MYTKVNFETAVQLLDSGKYDNALRMGKTLLRAQNRSPVLLQFCGTCAVKLGKLSEAKKYYSKLVKIHPKEAKYWSDLGYVYFTAGHFKPAKHAYAQAAKHEPNNPEHILNNALCRVTNDDLEGAAEQYSKALKLAPDHPRTLHGLANVRRQQSRPFEAMPYLLRLSKIAADRDPAFWVEYAEVAFSITDIPETLRAVENARKLRFHDADLETRIAILFSNMGYADKAVTSIERAIDIAPDDTEILNDAASIFKDAGDANTASDLYLKMISKQPYLAKAYFHLSQLRKFDPESATDAAYVVEMEKALSRDLTDPAFMHFALGKAFADLEDVDRAFHHLTIGNELRRTERPYSLHPDEERVERLKQRFPAGSVGDSLEPVPENTVSPIFIVGMPRSGTTLVEQIIGAHPQVTPCGELMLLPYILSTRFQNDEPELSMQAWAEIGDLYRSQILGLADSRSRITDKLPHNFFNVGAIWSALPDAKIILLQRNPLAIGLSCYQTLFSAGLDYTYDLTMIGRFYHLHKDLCDHWKEIAPNLLLEVQYEDLVQDIDVNIRRILTFCGLEWHPECERYFENHRRIGTASFNQANKPIYLSSVDKWRRYETHLIPLIEALAM